MEMDWRFWTKWSKVATNWYPRDGKRNRGRQHLRWENELKLTAGPSWRRVALDRAHWKDLEEAYALEDIK